MTPDLIKLLNWATFSIRQVVGVKGVADQQIEGEKRGKNVGGYVGVTTHYRVFMFEHESIALSI